MKQLSKTLFKKESPEITIEIQVKITEEGDLIVDGYDAGKLVKELKGDYDYEYYITVKKQDKELFIQKLNEQKSPITHDEDLLNWLVDNYSNNYAFSSIQTLLKQLDIKHETFYWV
jgi:6-pyruvoyl-tetrahydropterin synthase